MKNFVVTTFGFMLAISAVSPSCWAADLKFNGLGIDDDFLTANNWSDITFPVPPPVLPPVVTPGAAVPGVGDRANINDNFVVTYTSALTTTVESLIVGGDAPQMSGDFGTPGTLNMSHGKLIVAGGGDSFDIGRACCNDGAGDVSAVNLTGDAVLEIQGSDPIVGDRDRGELNIGPGASVISTRVGGAYWRIGNYGHSIDVNATFPTGLAGEGLLNVEGSFMAHVIFLGSTDGNGELRVSGTGSVALTDNLVPNVNTDKPNRSALVHMIGSNASLTALNLESFNGAAQVHNQYKFTADGGGVSEIKLTNAVNIGNNDLTVDLTSFALAPATSILLFDAAPGQIYGDGPAGFFDVFTVLGGASGANYYVVYDIPNGDILLARTVPEPSTMLLLGLGMSIAVCAKRRKSR